VGKQTQTPVEREMNYALSLFLTQYEKTRGLAHFGAELTEYTKKILLKGDLLFAFFNQTKEIQLPPAVSIFFVSCIYFDWFNEMDPKDLLKKRDHSIQLYKTDPTVKKMIDDLMTKTSLKELNESLTKHQKIIKNVCQL
jgi:F0F1-type ATP synthase alpha subunit